MTWVKLDDKMPDHPAIARAGPHAGWLFVCGLCYCSRHLTDGFIPTGVLGQVSNVPRPVAVAAELVAVGLWLTADGGWQVAEYSRWQRTRSEVERISELRAEAGIKGAKAKQTRSKPKASDTPEIQKADNRVTPLTPRAGGPVDKRHFLPGTGWVGEA